MTRKRKEKMKTMKRVAFLLLVVSLVAAALLGSLGTVAAASVTPEEISGNPSCTSVGCGTYEYKFDPPVSRRQDLGGGLWVEIKVSADGKSVDWSSNFPISCVLVKGANAANKYTYLDGSMGDTNLVSPDKGDNIPAISHVSFCYVKPQYKLDIDKSVYTGYTREWKWDIAKSVTPAVWNLFAGDTGTSKYTVAVTKSGPFDSGWKVWGKITIENNTPYVATITDVADVIMPGDINAVVDCKVTFPHDLLAGDQLVCDYEAGLPNADPRTNKATVTTSGMVQGNWVEKPVVFGDPTTVVNGSINVDDTNGMSWPFADSGSVWYEKTFDCSGCSFIDTLECKYKHENTATIRETKQSSKATVDVNCYKLKTWKDAWPYLTRTYKWTITKWADTKALTLWPGETWPVNYKVTVKPATPAWVDSGWGVKGEIKVYNPAPMDVEVTIEDVIKKMGVVDAYPKVTCDWPGANGVIPAGWTLVCKYETALSSGETRWNWATATMQNYAYKWDATKAALGTTAYQGSALIDFAKAKITEIDKCVEVYDDKGGDPVFPAYLGKVCYPDSGVFTYKLVLGPYDECGKVYQWINTAWLITSNTATKLWDTWTVDINVPCPGCTRTQGYWKTHSEFGPAPYDDTWAELPNGASTAFFKSGQSYYMVLWTPPAGGNAYYTLAHQYIAAELNVAKGAYISPAVLAEWNKATVLFQKYTPAEIAKMKGNDPVRAEFLRIAGILDKYNNGYLGTPHCSE
jgi:hypothetical protein